MDSIWTVSPSCSRAVLKPGRSAMPNTDRLSRDAVSSLGRSSWRAPPRPGAGTHSRPQPFHHQGGHKPFTQHETRGAALARGAVQIGDALTVGLGQLM